MKPVQSETGNTPQHKLMLWLLALFIMAPLALFAVQDAQANGTCVDNLAARSKTGKIQLTWADMPQTDKYEILRANDISGPFARIGETLSPGTTFLDASVTSGVLLYYQVRRIPTGAAACLSSVIAAVAPAGRTRMAIVPDLAGQTEAAAGATLVAARLATGNVATASSATVLAGQVISQDPPPNSSVPRNTPVDFVVSSGAAGGGGDTTRPLIAISSPADGAALNSSPVTVSGTASDETALAGVTVNGVVASVGGGTFSASVPLASGANTLTAVATDTSGNTASMSIQVTFTPPVVVPNVVGQAQAAAEAAIVAAGLTVGTVSSANSDTVPVDDVISQNPAGGASVAPNSAVDLVVSLGPVPVVVPDVVSQAQATAEADIVAAGLTVGTVTTQISDTVPAGDVISQIPVSGTNVALGSTVDLFVSSGPPAAAQLSLSTNVAPTQGAGGSVDADCVVLDSNDQVTGLPVDLTTDDPTAVITGATNFAFPAVGEFTITCEAIGFAGVTDSDTVVVVDDAVDPAYSAFGASLANLEKLHGDVLVANEADDVPGLQTAKDSLIAEIAGVDLAALAAAPPVPTGGDVPTNAELLAAGDVPDAVVDTPFMNSIQSIRQNLMDYDALLSSVSTTTLTQTDVDAMNALTTAAEALADTLDTLGDPSNTAILAVNTELNDIVSNLLPNQAVDVAQFTVDVIDTAPGIVRLDWQFDLLKPENMFAGLQQDRRGPEAFYAEPQKAFTLIGLMTSQSIANGLRSQYVKNVYKPLMKFIANNMKFLREQNLGPFGLNPANIDFVFGNGGAASTIFEGGWIQVWGQGFDPVAANNIIEVSTPNGVFTSAGTVVSIDSGGFDILDSGNFPSNMANHPFGLPGVGVVRVITPGGTSNGITVNVFR